MALANALATSKAARRWQMYSISMQCKSAASAINSIWHQRVCSSVASKKSGGA